LAIRGVLGVLGGILATSGAKSDVTFLLGDPDFLLVKNKKPICKLSYGGGNFYPPPSVSQYCC